MKAGFGLPFSFALSCKFAVVIFGVRLKIKGEEARRITP
jgi:hypothetical protein